MLHENRVLFFLPSASIEIIVQLSDDALSDLDAIALNAFDILDTSPIVAEDFVADQHL